MVRILFELISFSLLFYFLLLVIRSGSDAPFTLSAGFPPKDLDDPTKTIQEAGLVSASITHKIVS